MKIHPIPSHYPHPTPYPIPDPISPPLGSTCARYVTQQLRSPVPLTTYPVRSDTALTISFLGGYPCGAHSDGAVTPPPW